MEYSSHRSDRGRTRMSGLTLIEAPTGSGKTEAALAYASRLLAAGRADSIVFALPTQATANAMLSRLEAILLDPVYTGKGMAGLIDLARNGHFSKGENVVFIHTGGSAGLFGYRGAFNDSFAAEA